MAKDASWGSYHVTTLHAYEPVILENALIYSDNIYFAKAALKIGSDEMEKFFDTDLVSMRNYHLRLRWQNLSIPIQKALKLKYS